MIETRLAFQPWIEEAPSSGPAVYKPGLLMKAYTAFIAQGKTKGISHKETCLQEMFHTSGSFEFDRGSALIARSYRLCGNRARCERPDPSQSPPMHLNMLTSYVSPMAAQGLVARRSRS